jgi:hypothetical protein
MIRGFDTSGQVRFTCHLTPDPATDEVWIYQVPVDESTVERRAVMMVKSK